MGTPDVWHRRIPFTPTMKAISVTLGWLTMCPAVLAMPVFGIRAFLNGGFTAVSNYLGLGVGGPYGILAVWLILPAMVVVRFLRRKRWDSVWEDADLILCGTSFAAATIATKSELWDRPHGLEQFWIQTVICLVWAAMWVVRTVAARVNRTSEPAR